MNEITEAYKDLRKAQQEKRASNRMQSRQRLIDADIPFEEKNGGAHLIVEGREGYIDFWPGTGRWIPRYGTKTRGFGIRNLINHIHFERE